MKAHRGKTTSDAEFRRMWLDLSITATEIGRRLDISVQAVKSRARVRGLPPRPGGGGRNRKVDPLLFRLMWAANVGGREIARHFGIHENSVHSRARRWGLPTRNCTIWNRKTVTEFQQERLAAKMAEAARVEQAAIINAEMADYSGGRVVGSRMVRVR